MGTSLSAGLFLFCLSTVAHSAVYDLCVRGNGPTFTRTAHVRLTVDGPDLGQHFDKLAGQLTNRQVWEGKAEEIIVERFQKISCGAALGDRYDIALSITEEELNQLAADLDRGPGAETPTLGVLGNRAEISRVLGSTPKPGQQIHYVIRVFFATNRKDTHRSRPRERFGVERADVVSFGTVTVTIPKAHQMGDLETPNILALEFSEDPEKHITLQSVQSMNLDAWREELRQAPQASAEPRVLLFVHGYKVSFADAATRTGQLAYDLSFPGPAVFFSWPSRGKVSSYTADEQAVEWSLPDMKRVLAQLATLAPNIKVYIIAHSMGNRVLTSAFGDLLSEDLTKRRAFKEILLTAPDIDADVFKRNIAPKILGKGPRFTLYASDNDAALAASKRFHGGHRRLGGVGEAITVLPDMDSIDATNVSTELLGHSYFADSTTVLSDMFYLIRQGLKPSERFALQPLNSSAGVFWRFKPVKK